MPNRADALNVGRTRLGEKSVLKRDHPQLAPHGVEQFAWREQKRRIGGLADAFVSLREGLVNQYAAGRERAQQLRKERPMQVVGDDDGSELFIASQWPRRTFEIGYDRRDERRVAQKIERSRVAIDRGDGMAERRKKNARAARRPMRRRAPRRPVRSGAPSDAPSATVHRGRASHW
ncbi:hypothetical protein OKW42_007309 [Paraburkholderia sp. WC7.3d]